MKSKKFRRILPLCLTAVIAAGATTVFDHITLKGDLAAYAGMFGDVNGDGVVNASDAAIILQFAAWSGAGNEGSLEYYLAQRGILQPTVEPTQEATQPVTELPTEAVTEAPTDPAEETSDLYAALSAEWAKTGDTSTKTLEGFKIGAISDGNAALYQEKIYFLPSGTGKKLMCYDIASKELTEVPTLEGAGATDTFYFSGDGHIYVIDYPNELHKYDLEGNELGFIELRGLFLFSDTGYLFEKTAYFTPDLEKKTFPDLIIKDSHGLDNKLSLTDVIVAYGSKCILRVHDSVTDAYEYYCFDAETESYTKMPDCPLRPLDYATKRIGTYWIGDVNSCCVYDMENNTMLAENLPRDFGVTYFGGSANIQSIKQDNQLVFQRVTAIPGESEYDQDTAVEIGTAETSGNYRVYLLDDTRYLFADNAGIFLRTYEKGAEGEELVYRFEQ